MPGPSGKQFGAIKAKDKDSVDGKSLLDAIGSVQQDRDAQRQSGLSPKKWGKKKAKGLKPAPTPVTEDDNT